MRTSTVCYCVLFISLVQLINRAQFLNITFLFLLFVGAAVPVFGTVIVPLHVCMHRYNQINLTLSLKF